MNRSNAALKRSIVTRTQIQSLLAMRESLDAMKKRYDLLENSVKATEQEIIAQIESGIEVDSDYDLQIRTSERRYPAWKSYFVEVAGAAAAERVLAETLPTIYKTLIVK